MTLQSLEMLHHVMVWFLLWTLVYEISSVNCMADCDNIEKRALFHNLICFFHILWIILRMFDDYYYIL